MGSPAVDTMAKLEGADRDDGKDGSRRRLGTVELRVTQNGHRPRETRLPSPEELDRIVEELMATAVRIRGMYRRELELAISASGGSEIRISGGEVSRPTERAWAALQGPGMAHCREAAKAMRDARDSIRYAYGELGGPAQPRRLHPRAAISQAEFDEALHKQRERELRGGV